jgi:hypothetical protein
MEQEELKFPEWQRPVQDVILEFDPEKLGEKVQKVELLLFERSQQLATVNGDGKQERQAIDDALGILRVIKHDRLDYPDWK